MRHIPARSTALDVRGRGRKQTKLMETMAADENLPFWKTKSLEEMSEEEWESLCDGCARCCLVKLEDEDSGEIHYTDLGCTLLDTKTCRCRDYKNRQAKVSDCVKLTPAAARTLSWLPPTCAYRIVAAGGELPNWHPLVSGSLESVRQAEHFGQRTRLRQRRRHSRRTLAGPDRSLARSLAARAKEKRNEALGGVG